MAEYYGYCIKCGENGGATKNPGVGPWKLHLALTLITLGLWGLFIWAPLKVFKSAGPAKCDKCGLWVVGPPV